MSSRNSVFTSSNFSRWRRIQNEYKTGRIRATSQLLGNIIIPVNQTLNPLISLRCYKLNPMSSNTTSTTKSAANPTCSTTCQNTDSQNTCNATKGTGVNADANKSCPMNSDACQDYYQALNLKPTASQEEVEKSYKKLASEWYPERKNENRMEAQKKFNKVTHAFHILSDPAKRACYDQLTQKKFSKEDALKTFENFFQENDILEDEQEFFKKNNLQQNKNYYQMLGVQKNASTQEINDAFRKLSLQNNPKNKPGCKDTESKFKGICEAYNNIGNQKLRQQYDKIIASEMPTEMAYEQFNSRFAHDSFEDEKDQKTLGKVVKKASEKQQLQAKEHHHHHQNKQNSGLHHDPHSPLGKHHHFVAEEEITQEVTTKKGPNGTTTKKVTHKSSQLNGKHTKTRIEETTNPDGTQDVVETIEDNQGKKVNEYQIKDGKKLPKAIKS